MNLVISIIAILIKESFMRILIKNYCLGIILVILGAQAHAAQIIDVKIPGANGQPSDTSISFIKYDEDIDRGVDKYLMRTELTVRQLQALLIAFPELNDIDSFGKPNKFCKRLLNNPEFPAICIDEPLASAIAIRMTKYDSRLKWSIPKFEERTKAVTIQEDGSYEDLQYDPLYANCGFNAALEPVAQRAPTGLGFYDVLGNAGEMFAEKRRDYYYQRNGSCPLGSANCMPTRVNYIAIFYDRGGVNLDDIAKCVTGNASEVLASSSDRASLLEDLKLYNFISVRFMLEKTHCFNPAICGK